MAIELAAARRRLLSPSPLLEKLENRLSILIGGPRDLPRRQQTMCDTIDWSYDLLEPDERRLFDCLGVFANGFTLGSLEATCPGADSSRSLDLLSSLVEKSLVRSRIIEAELRFDLLETLHEYAVTRLSGSEHEKSLRRRHADHFLALASEADRSLHGPRQLRCLMRLEHEHANLRVAIEWSIAQDDLERAARFGQALWYFWFVRGYTFEDGDDREAELLALVTRTYPAAGLGRATVAHTALEESLRIAESIGNRCMSCYVLTSLGRLEASLGRFDDAIALIERAVEGQCQVGDSSITALCCRSASCTDDCWRPYASVWATLRSSLNWQREWRRIAKTRSRSRALARRVSRRGFDAISQRDKLSRPRRITAATHRVVDERRTGGE